MKVIHPNKIAWEHFKAFYDGPLPEDAYLNRSEISVPSEAPFSQIVALDEEAPKSFFLPDEKVIEEQFCKLVEGLSPASSVEDFTCRGFKVLSKSPVNEGVVYRHADLPGWLLKNFPRETKPICAKGLKPTKEEDQLVAHAFRYSNILRGYYSRQIQELVVKKMPFVGVEDIRLVPRGDESIPIKHRYWVLSKQENILPMETKSILYQLPEATQRRLVLRICDFIKRSGFADSHNGNFTFKASALKNLDGNTMEIVNIDAEPLGLIKSNEDPSKERLLSFDEAVVVGIGRFIHALSESEEGEIIHAGKTIRDEALDSLEELVNFAGVQTRRLKAIRKQRLIKAAKIIASTVCPFIPLGVACKTLFEAHQWDPIHWVQTKWRENRPCVKGYAQVPAQAA